MGQVEVRAVRLAGGGVEVVEAHAGRRVDDHRQAGRLRLQRARAVVVRVHPGQQAGALCEDNSPLHKPCHAGHNLRSVQQHAAARGLPVAGQQPGGIHEGLRSEPGARVGLTRRSRGS